MRLRDNVCHLIDRIGELAGILDEAAQVTQSGAAVEEQGAHPVGHPACYTFPVRARMAQRSMPL